MWISWPFGVKLGPLSDSLVFKDVESLESVVLKEFKKLSCEFALWLGLSSFDETDKRTLVYDLSNVFKSSFLLLSE